MLLGEEDAGVGGGGFGGARRGERAARSLPLSGRVSARRGAPAAARHDSTPGERRCTQILPLPPRR